MWQDRAPTFITQMQLSLDKYDDDDDDDDAVTTAVKGSEIISRVVMEAGMAVLAGGILESRDGHELGMNVWENEPICSSVVFPVRTWGWVYLVLSITCASASSATCPPRSIVYRSAPAATPTSAITATTTILRGSGLGFPARSQACCLCTYALPNYQQRATCTCSEAVGSRTHCLWGWQRWERKSGGRDTRVKQKQTHYCAFCSAHICYSNCSHFIFLIPK